MLSLKWSTFVHVEAVHVLIYEVPGVHEPSSIGLGPALAHARCMLIVGLWGVGVAKSKGQDKETPTCMFRAVFRGGL